MYGEGLLFFFPPLCKGETLCPSRQGCKTASLPSPPSHAGGYEPRVSPQPPYGGVPEPPLPLFPFPGEPLSAAPLGAARDPAAPKSRGPKKLGAGRGAGAQAGRGDPAASPPGPPHTPKPRPAPTAGLPTATAIAALPGPPPGCLLGLQHGHPAGRAHAQCEGAGRRGGPPPALPRGWPLPPPEGLRPPPGRGSRPLRPLFPNPSAAGRRWRQSPPCSGDPRQEVAEPGTARVPPLPPGVGAGTLLKVVSPRHETPKGRSLILCARKGCYSPTR